MKSDRILLIMTGGTIGSFGDDNNNNRDTNIDKAKYLLLQNYENNKANKKVDFDVVTLLDTLSENMTIDKWNQLLLGINELEVSVYEGIIIAHGTDTLAYTSSLLALMLGNIKLPVFLVSANAPLNMESSNGNDNFAAAVRLITMGIPADVYVTYRNSDGVVYLHKGCHLEQCKDYSEDFFSVDMQPVLECIDRGVDLQPVRRKSIELKKKLSDNVLMIEPYVGINYSRYNLCGVKAVIHGLYHSMTACVDGEKSENSSIISFIRSCKESNLPLIITPAARTALYSSGADMLKVGVGTVYGLTKEMVYVKTVVAIARGIETEAELVDFLQEEICGEIIKGY